VGQKVHPLGFRLGVFEDWSELMEDLQIRKYLKNKLNQSDISKVVIEKAGENIRIVIFSSRPGFIIGKKGMGIEQLKRDIYDKFKKNVEFSIQEVKLPELNASLVAKSIAEQLERRVGFKRAMKKVGFGAMKAGAKGIKICCSGRLGGSEIARSEWLRIGSVPLHTLRSDVQFALAEAKTTYGMIGVKVWICKGEYR
jgi:small subunit ribosomal protein S3